MSAEIQLTVNGQSRKLSTEPNRPLLDVLREDLALTGTKYGCGEGSCRACTVLVDGKPVQSCLTPVSATIGKKIETIESLCPNHPKDTTDARTSASVAAVAQDLHPVQKAFIEHEGMQCGYCVPGMIMTTVALLREKQSPSREEIITALNGNLCRCCGYTNLLKAVEAAAKIAA
jgi:aerobic-type carbon monoxide dehydrogenase small subunit (CoxS/CutS family)